MSFYSATKVIIENSNAEILMVQEAKDFIHESWDFPGGGWEEGESIIECAKREALEETGYPIEIESLISIYKGDSNSTNTETIVFVFKACVKGKRHKEELEDDVIDVDYFSPEEIRKLDLREENRLEILEKYQKGENYPLNMLLDDLNLLE